MTSFPLPTTLHYHGPSQADLSWLPLDDQEIDLRIPAREKAPLDPPTKGDLDHEALKPPDGTPPSTSVTPTIRPCVDMLLNHATPDPLHAGHLHPTKPLMMMTSLS
eukprot:gene1290-32638_t